MACSTFVLLARFREETAPPRFGFTVTKKLGNAVARNRIKRRLREAVRAGARPEAGYDYVLIARHKAFTCAYADLLRDMTFAFSKIATMKNTASIPTVPNVRS